jgi:hypothetical protein
VYALLLQLGAFTGDVVASVTSTVTAAGILYAVRLLRQIRDETSANWRRSKRNEAALDLAGAYRPPIGPDGTPEMDLPPGYDPRRMWREQEQQERNSEKNRPTND